MLQSMGLQRVGHDLATEQQQLFEQSSFPPEFSLTTPLFPCYIVLFQLIALSLQPFLLPLTSIFKPKKIPVFPFYQILLDFSLKGKA